MGIWNAFIDSGVTRHEAQQWCLAHAFELVELNPQELPDEDGEFGQDRDSKICDCTQRIHIYFTWRVLSHTGFCYLSDDFPESTGVKRIVQALNANVWTSVQMKDGEVTPHWNSRLDLHCCSVPVHDIWLLMYLSGLNQGFGLMTSLVASRHNNPHPYTSQEALVSIKFYISIHYSSWLLNRMLILVEFSICHFFLCANLTPLSLAVFQLASRGRTHRGGQSFRK